MGGSNEVTRSMPRLGPRHVALAVNAAAAREGGERVLSEAAQRILNMQRDPIQEYVFSEQTVAMIFNSFARTGTRDVRLFSCLSDVIRGREKGFQSGENIAVVLNALVRTGFRDAPLFQRLSLDTQELQVGALSVASSAKILHAFAATRTQDRRLFAFLSQHLQLLHARREQLKAQDSAGTARVTADAAGRQSDGRTSVAEGMGVSLWGWGLREGVEVAGSGVHGSAGAWPAEGAVGGMGMFGAFGVKPEGWAEGGGTGQGGPERPTAQSVAMLLNAVAKLKMDDGKLLVVLAATAREVPEAEHSAQGISMMANALSAMRRRGVRDWGFEALEAQVRRLVVGLPLDAWAPRSLAVVANAFGWLAGAGAGGQGVGQVAGKRRGKWNVKIKAQPGAAQPRGVPAGAVTGRVAGSDEVSDARVFGRLAAAVAHAAADEGVEFSGADISMILNGFAKGHSGGGGDGAGGGGLQGVLAVLSPRAMALPGSKLSAQDLALIFSACARVGYAGGGKRSARGGGVSNGVDRSLLLHLSACARETPAAGFSGQSVAVMMGALAQLSFDHLPLLVHLCNTALALPHTAREFAPHHVGTTLRCAKRDI